MNRISVSFYCIDFLIALSVVSGSLGVLYFVHEIWTKEYIKNNQKREILDERAHGVSEISVTAVDQTNVLIRHKVARCTILMSVW